MKASGFSLLAVLLPLLSSCGTSTRVDPSYLQRVYNTGYGTITEAERTSSISHVEMADNDSSYQTIYEYIQGRVPGVSVRTNGDGTNPKIIIRGVGTINASTDPLFIVDGVEVPDISWLSPRDVKSIDVLKDASACSIYGIRGANGVIIINTK